MALNGMYPMGSNIVRLAADDGEEKVESKASGLKESLDQIGPLEKVVKGLTAAAEALDGTAWEDLRTGVGQLLDKSMEAQEQVLEQTRAELRSKREQGQGAFVPTPGMISGAEEIPADAAIGSGGATVVQPGTQTRL